MAITVVDIPELASNAAFELDQIAKGRSSDLESSKALADYIKQSINSTQGQISASFRNSSSENVLYMAVRDSFAHPPKTLGELIDEAFSIAGDLGDTQGSKAQEQLVHMRTFCVALANAALAHRRNLADLQPKPEYYR